MASPLGPEADCRGAAWKNGNPRGLASPLGALIQKGLFILESERNRGWNSYFTNPRSKITSPIWTSNRDKSSSLHYSATPWWEEMLSEKECHFRGRKGRKDESR